MIQKVLIAPLEQWCPQLLSRDLGQFERLVGVEVEIETDSMKRREELNDDPCLCEGPFWRVTARSREATAILLERGTVAWWVCRHQLEMD